MDCEGIKRSALTLLLAGAAGCGSEGNGTDTTSVVASDPAGTAAGPVAGGSDLWWRNDAYRELDGDEENAERLVATVSKGPLDSTTVRLEIRTSKDRLLYRHEWPATSYMKYGPPGSAKDSVAVLREAEQQIGKIFADSAFITSTPGPRYSEMANPDLEAIRYDIAEHEYRAARLLKRWESLPPSGYDELDTFALAVPLARIQAVAAETRAMPAFWYYAGGEETYVVAWSASEGRMVRIAACC